MNPLLEIPLWVIAHTAAVLAVIYVPHWLAHRLPASDDR